VGDMDWIYLVQGMDRWRAVVHAVMKLRVPYNAVNFLTSWETASREGLCSMKNISMDYTCFVLSVSGPLSLTN